LEGPLSSRSFLSERVFPFLYLSTYVLLIHCRAYSIPFSPCSFFRRTDFCFGEHEPLDENSGLGIQPNSRFNAPILNLKFIVILFSCPLLRLDNGIVVEGKIVALRPVTVEPPGYALRNYGATKEELKNFEKRIHGKIEKNRKGISIRRLTKTIYECRVGLDERLAFVFKSTPPELIFSA